MQQCHSGCTSQVVIVRTPTRVCLLHWYFHLLLFTNCRGKCHEVGHSSSDLDIQVLENHPGKRMYFTLDPLDAKPLLRHKGRYTRFLFLGLFYFIIYLFIYLFSFLLIFVLVIKSCITYYCIHIVMFSYIISSCLFNFRSEIIKL